MAGHYLEHLFAPRSVAVVGASERAGSLGGFAIQNLIAGKFSGELVAVNPKYRRVEGIACFPALPRIGHQIDLVLVATPAATVPRIMADAGKAGIRHAVVLSAGFGETGPAGKALELEVLNTARRYGIRVIGPNCLGIMRPSIGLNATFARTVARRGSIALVSQSGAIATALVDWAQAAGVGFSSVISMGAGIDLDFGEILDYLLHDAQTRSILLYVEGVHDARRFVSGLRAAARVKPIIVLKVGRHISGSRAAMSHTGSMVGNDAVFDAVLRRCGVARVKTYSELFSAADLLGSGHLPRGNRLGILTNGGGPGVMAADYTADAGVELAQFSAQTIDALNAFLPGHWSHGNPADILGDATVSRLSQAAALVLGDDGVDALVTLFCPQQICTSDAAAQAIVETARKAAKPVLTVWLGESEIRSGRGIAEKSGLPAFRSPESAVAAFGTLAAYHRAQKLLLEVPPPLSSSVHPDFSAARAVADKALASGRTLLTEPEAKSLLAGFGIPVPRTVAAASASDVKAAARELGFPLVMKILSPDIAHKSDVKGVRLNIRTEETLLREYESLLQHLGQARPGARVDGVVLQPMIEKRFGRELMIGVTTDPVFGRVISFGAGGVAVEILRDYAVGLPPLNRILAQDLVSRTRTARLLSAYRHIPPADMDAILDVLLRVSEMVCALPWLSEMDINPLLADEAGCMAVDARVVIDAGRMGMDPRYSHMAIHPYPIRLERNLTTGSGRRVTIRPIRPEDAQLEAEFVRNLSDQSRYMRFFSATRELSPAMLARFTQVDYDRELALIALPEDRPGPMLGVARYTPNPDGESCEFAVTVDDRWQGTGIAGLLMLALIDAARERGFRTMDGTILKANRRMLKFAKQLGFTVSSRPEDSDTVTVALPL